MSALKMKHMDLDEIDRLAEYISQAREKMDKELVRLHKYEQNVVLRQCFVSSL